MPINFRNFSASETIIVKADSNQDAAFLLGQQMRDVCAVLTARIRKKENYAHSYKYHLAKMMYEKMQAFSSGDTFTVDSVNWMGRYRQRFEHYCRGAGISAVDGMLMQLEMTGCQTIINRFSGSGNIQVIHLEENVDDPDILRYYKTGVRDVASLYRTVNYQAEGRSWTYFSYPGFCFGGAAMGYSSDRRIFMAVDTLETIQKWDVMRRCDLSVNTVAAMIFDVADPDLSRKLLVKIRRKGIRILGGYALHLTGAGTKAGIYSYETGDRYIRVLAPMQIRDDRCVIQVNYPRTKDLLKMDLFGPPGKSAPFPKQRVTMLTIEMKRRLARLRRVASDMRDGNVSEAKENLLKTIADSSGDVERARNGGRLFTGFVTPYLVGYSVAVLTPNQDLIEIGKDSPPELADKPFRRFYDAKDKLSVKYAGRDLWKIAARQVRRRKRRLV